MNMTVEEAITNALEFLAALGYKSGDVVDDLGLALARLKSKYPKAAKDTL